MEFQITIKTIFMILVTVNIITFAFAKDIKTRLIAGIWTIIILVAFL